MGWWTSQILLIPSKLAPMKLRVTLLIWLSRGFAYVADNRSGLWVVDISNLANPLQLVSMKPQVPRRVWLSQALCLCGGWDGLTVLDVSNPANPVAVSYRHLRFCAGCGCLGELCLCSG
jgi:hypothetical protein